MTAERRAIASGSPLEATVGYARAVAMGEWCFVSGTTGADPETRIMPERTLDQARNAFSAIEAALVSAGFTMADIVRATIYLVDARDWPILIPLLGAVLGPVRPAATCVIVAGLVAPEMKVEIEVTAYRPADPTRPSVPPPDSVSHGAGAGEMKP